MVGIPEADDGLTTNALASNVLSAQLMEWGSSSRKVRGGGSG